MRTDKVKLIQYNYSVRKGEAIPYRRCDASDMDGMDGRRVCASIDYSSDI
jgi:hypothetical protein